MALLEAEKQERKAMEKREAARRRLYRERRMDEQWLMQARSRHHDRFARHALLESDFDRADYFDSVPERHRRTFSTKSEPPKPTSPVSSETNPKQSQQPPAAKPEPPVAKSSGEDEEQPDEEKSPDTGLA